MHLVILRVWFAAIGRWRWGGTARGRAASSVGVRAIVRRVGAVSRVLVVLTLE